MALEKNTSIAESEKLEKNNNMSNITNNVRKLGGSREKMIFIVLNKLKQCKNNLDIIKNNKNATAKM